MRTLTTFNSWPETEIVGHEKELFGKFCMQTTTERKFYHRGRLDIISHILSAATGGVRKTAIMYKCNLSFKQLEVYLSFLLRKRLLRAFAKHASSTSYYFETTNKGMDFLVAYRNLEALITE